MLTHGRRPRGPGRTMRSAISGLLAWGLAALSVAFAFSAPTARAATLLPTTMAEPKPSPDHPRKVVLQLGDDNVQTMNDVLYNAVALQKFYGMDNVRIAVIAYGPGLRAFYKDGSPVKARIQSLEMYGIDFLACGNTLRAQHKTPQDLIDGVDVVPAAMPELVERRLRGWVVLRP